MMQLGNSAGRLAAAANGVHAAASVGKRHRRLLRCSVQAAAARQPQRQARRTSVALPVLGICGVVVLKGGFRCFATAARAEAAAPVQLPLHDLSLLHQHFGGDASVHANQPMPQRARSGGTISALSVQIPALQKLAPYLQRPGAQIFDLGFGSGVMVAMMLAVAGEGATVVGVDLSDKVEVATENLLARWEDCPFSPFPTERFSLIGGDAFERLPAWEKEGKVFDVVYSGCSMDPLTDQLRRFLGRMKPNGAAVFNLGRPGRQGMYFVADGGMTCELLMHVNFMMAVSPDTPPMPGAAVPLDPDDLGAWIRANVFPVPREDGQSQRQWRGHGVSWGSGMPP